VHNEKVAKIAFSALLSVLLYGHSAVVLASEAPQTKLAATAALCKEAIVNPVSGYAECVRPPGAPVDPKLVKLIKLNGQSLAPTAAQ